MTATTRITRALQIIGVQASGETMEASVGADALAVLNAMLGEWDDAGFGFVSPAYASLAATDTLPSADDEAIAFNLAIRLAPEYNYAPSEVMLAGAAGLLAQLVSRYNKPTY